jgi:hypothetical protein
MSFLISNHRSVTKNLQYVFEGSRTTPASWGTTPATPTFVQAGYSPTFTYTDQPEGVDVKVLGTEAKITRVKVGMSGLLDVRTHLTDSALAKWFYNAFGGGAGTIDDSATFLYTHQVLGVDTYRILKGCIPLNATLDVPHRGIVELSGQILVTQPVDEGAFSGISAAEFGGTTPTYATQPTGPPWTHLSGGSQPLTIGNNNYRDRGMRVSITRELSLLDSSGDTNVLFARAARKTITGTITAFRIDSLNQAAAVALTEFAGTTTRVLKTATSTITFTKLQFQDHPTDYSLDSSDALMEELTFACSDIAIS